jgi:hypothetical protein
MERTPEFNAAVIFSPGGASDAVAASLVAPHAFTACRFPIALIRIRGNPERTLRPEVRKRRVRRCFPRPR